MLETLNLKAPSDVAKKAREQTRRVESFLRSSKLRWGPDKLDNLEKFLWKRYEASRKETRPLRRKLIEWNDLLEGVVEETNFPFEGASNLTLHYAAGIVGTFRSQFVSTQFQDPDIFSVSSRPGSGKHSPDDLKNHEEGLNYIFHSDSNGLDILKDAVVPCVRDGTAVVQGSWERRLERGNDSRIYGSALDFNRDYPSAEASGLSEEDYASLMDKWIFIQDFELQTKFHYDFVAQDGIEFSIISLANFIFWPTYAPTIRRMEMYGSLYEMSPVAVKLAVKQGEFYKERADEALKGGRKFGGDEWSASRNFVERLARTLGDEDQPIQLADLVVKWDSDDDGIPEKYLVTYAPEARKVLAVDNYPIRRNIDMAVALRMVKRENRFLGVSLVGDTEDLFLFMDTIHNHRNNVRMIATSPVFKTNEQYKEALDLGRSENVFRPGLNFWINAKDWNTSIEQVAIANLDQPGNSLDEEAIIERKIELRFGPTQGLSGRETPSDPRAPAAKTLGLLQQATKRIDDYGEEWQSSYPDIAELTVALRLQYGPDRVSFQGTKEGQAAPVDISRDDFALEGVRYKGKRRSVTLSPEFAMQRLGGLMQVYAGLMPLLVQQDPRAIELWNRTVRASGEPDVEKLLWQGKPLGLPLLPGAPGGPGGAPGAPGGPLPSPAALVGAGNGAGSPLAGLGA